MIDLRDKTNREFIPLRSENISQRRELFKHIAIISAGVLGLVGIFFDKNEINKNYFFIGIILHAVTVILSLSYLRESLDKEGNDLQDLQDNYNVIAKTKLAIVDKYIISSAFSPADFKKYHEELEKSEVKKRLDADIVAQDVAREARTQKKQDMDYFGEFIMACFLCGSFYVLISIIPLPIGNYWIILITALLIFIPFFNFTLKIVSLINFIIKSLRDDGN